MAYIFDYLDWRGDLRLDQVPFNPIDGLILALVSYLDFEGIVPHVHAGPPVTIEDAARAFFTTGADTRMIARRLYRAESYVKLIGRLEKSERFRRLRLTGYADSTDSDLQKQFAAVTVLGAAIPQKPLERVFGKLFGKVNDESLIYIAYRGTDDTLVGWKEDFNMSFLTAVPSQLEAVVYLQQVAAQHPGRLTLGGHSKGGNLAAYAAAGCPAAVQARIAAVQNFDGPGFSPAILASGGYRAILNRIHTYLPQSSIIGMLLEHEEAFTVVHSTQTGFNQHDPFSWELTASDFVGLDSVTDGSQFIDRTLSDWLKRLDESQRRQFIDTFYEVLTSTGAETFAELSSDWFKHAGTMIKSLKTIDPESRQVMSVALQMFLKSVKTNMPPLNPIKKISSFFERSTDGEADDSAGKGSSPTG